MTEAAVPDAAAAVIIDIAGLGALVDALWRTGYRVMGPTVRDGAIRLGELRTAGDLPTGWGDEQAPGHYRLRRRNDEARFGYAVGPDSPRRELSPPRVDLVTIRRRNTSFDASTPDHTPQQPLALIGMRGCELAAMRVHGHVMTDGPYPDPVQLARSTNCFIVAVDCGSPADTCFCTSMQTGPSAEGTADVRLCELLDGEHRFLCWPMSAAGAQLLAGIPHRSATAQDVSDALAVRRTAESRITKRLNTTAIRERLAAALDHPQWDDVASRCLSCTNCTMVCPTCFCSTITDVDDLSGTTTTRVRTWDSCFTLEHSYTNGGAVHATTKSRYRQWLTHKLGTWWDQFGESGCVGCGRCTTWCPAAIDFVVEANLISALDTVGQAT